MGLLGCLASVSFGLLDLRVFALHCVLGFGFGLVVGLVSVTRFDCGFGGRFFLPF